MSWAIRIEPATKAELLKALKKAPVEFQDLDEAKSQGKLAKALVTRVLNSGALGGDENSVYGVSIGGHANPEHKTAPGSSGDAIYINVYKLREVDEL